MAVVLLALALFEFAVYPGHTWLAAASQRFLPILERLDTPGFLSRDLVATHPNVAFTISDEATLFFHDVARVPLRTALQSQQFLCGLAGLTGLFLLARAVRLSDAWALTTAAAVSTVAFLPGLSASVPLREPVPVTLAWGFSLLALGLMAREKPLLAGMFGGIALLYDPVTSAPFWAATLLTFALSRPLRPLIRPMFPILLVFGLLLANLAQLQPGTADAQRFFSRLPAPAMTIEHFRLPELWVSLWARGDLYFYLAVWVLGIWATTRLWPELNLQTRWYLAIVPLGGLLTLPLSFALLEGASWSMMPKLQLLETLRFTLVVSALLIVLAGVKAVAGHKRAEAAAWLVSGLWLLAITHPRRAERIPPGLHDLAQWAESSTWGSSMFLFPDAGQANYPGVFRAESRRALWVDWESGAQMSYFAALAPIWFERWQQTMAAGLAAEKLQAGLSLPIDYYVVRSSHPLQSEQDGRLENVRCVYRNREFLVYDANDLRNESGKLRMRRR